MYQASEIVQLLLVAVLMPVLLLGIRNIDVAGKRWFVAAYLVMAVGNVLTVAEGYLAPDLFNVLEHLAYAGAGVCAAIAMRAFLHSTRAEVSA